MARPPCAPERVEPEDHGLSPDGARVIWILVVVVVGMVVILAQLLLAYQKRAVRLRFAQNPVRRQITDHRHKLTELAETIRGMADTGLQQLQTNLSDLTRRSSHAANVVAELDPEAQARAEEMELAIEEEGEGDGSESGNGHEDEALDELLGERREIGRRIGADELNPVELVRSVRHDLEESYNYLESLRTDATLLRQTASRLAPAEKAEANGRRP